MATVAEILKASGFTDDQIAALDARAITAFGSVLSTAEQASQAATAAAAKAESDRQAAIAAKEAAELAGRANTEFYEQKIIPGLTGWEAEQKALQTERANAVAEAAFYKAQHEALKSAGLLPTDAPVFAPPVAPAGGNRDATGRYISGVPGSTPGSPTFTMDEVRNNLGTVMGTLTDVQWKYQQLYGKPMPMAPTELVRQAEARKLDPATFAAQTFNFQGREQELAKQAADAEKEALRAEVARAKDEEYGAKLKAQADEFAAKERPRAKQIGNNPDVRMPAGSSKMAEIKRAVENKTLPDPLKMTDAERRQATRAQIHKEIDERSMAVA